MFFGFLAENTFLDFRILGFFIFWFLRFPNQFFDEPNQFSDGPNQFFFGSNLITYLAPKLDPQNPDPKTARQFFVFGFLTKTIGTPFLDELHSWTFSWSIIRFWWGSEKIGLGLQKIGLGRQKNGGENQKT